MMRKFLLSLLFCLVVAYGSRESSAFPIETVSPASLTHITNFRAFGDGTDFGTGVFDVSENFVGQTITVGGITGVLEMLSGNPTNPLTLEGSFDSICTFPGSIAGRISPPVGNSCGEGAMAFLFENGQSEIAAKIGGANGGSVTFEFFRDDATSLGAFTFEGLTSGDSFGFRRTGNVNDIAGFHMFNNDAAGLTLESLSFGAAVNISEPGSFALLSFGLIGLAAARSRAQSC